MRMQAPANSGGCSFGGRQFDVDSKGYVNVPDKAVISLMSHGYIPAGESKDEEHAPAINAALAQIAARKRLDDALIAQQAAQGAAATAKASGDQELLRQAMAAVATANVEVEAAHAALAP